MPTYTRANLKGRINAGIKGKLGILVSQDDLVNDVVREVVSEIDLRSTRRKANLSPNLFTEVFEYAAPTDLKGYGVISLDPQAQQIGDRYYLVPNVEFKVNREVPTMAIRDNDFVRKILISAHIDDRTLVISPLSGTTSGGGIWTGFGDGSNLRADTDNYIKSGSSLRWDIDDGATTAAGIQNSDLNVFDGSNYFQGNGALFVWTDIADVTDVTNFVMRLGNDLTANYHSKTVTTDNSGVAFINGWNLLRFPLTSLTTTGTVTNTSLDSVALYMTKTSGKISETDYRFDHIMLKIGEIHELFYYSKYGWQNTSGTYIENSTSDSDLLNVDTDEFNLMIAKGIELAGPEVGEDAAATKAEGRYEKLKNKYEKENPSEAKLMNSTVMDFI